jgi:hypothetical protein
VIVIHKGRMMGLRYIVDKRTKEVVAEVHNNDLAAVIKPVPQRDTPTVAKPTRYQPAPTRPNSGKRKRQWR